MNNHYTPVTAKEAVQVIKSGDHVHLASVSASPQCLIEAMCERGRNKEFQNVYVHHLHTEGPAPYASEEFAGVFQHNAFFVGKNVRKAVQSGFADYIPVNLVDTQRLYRDGVLPCDVAMIQVCPPDEHGFVSMGTSVDATLAAVEKAHAVIAVVNPNVPRTFGDSIIPMSMIDIFVEDDSPVMEAPVAQPDSIQDAIGRHVAELIDDGACLQMGIGAIPNAVLTHLGDHKNLGIHTEMFSDGALPLIEKGIINGTEKIMNRSRVVATFVMGTKKLYDFVNDNAMVRLMDVGYTNDPRIIASQTKMTAINSALEIDITGQVCAESIGTKFFSGIGGQIDFVTGAALSKGGKNIMAMPSATSRGESKIVPTLKEGAIGGAPRSMLHWIVTEYGAVYVYGKSLQERAKLLISIAHPDHREELEKAAFERYGSHFVYIEKA
ncbi:MAG: acetyl-CoA hydrolase/transferase family protein [Bacteroidales bacterium]|nr:acetyl-CoA hydrolase/transferase family protein [Bacteroidales bacterium]